MAKSPKMITDPIVPNSINPEIVKLTPAKYKYPESLPSEYLPAKKPNVIIERDFVIQEFMTGSTWEMLSMFYVVDVETLKKLFWVDYERAQASLKMNIIKSTVLTAIEGNHSAQRFLCTNWLGLTEKSPDSVPTSDLPYKATEVDAKIEALLSKLQINQPKEKKNDKSE